MLRKQNNKHITVYSGVIPSTTFIERLIQGVSKGSNTVFLFGELKKKGNYNKNVVVSGYSGKINKLFRLIWFTFLLTLFKNSDKKRLDQWINTRNRNKRLLRIKCYPVLWYKPDVFHLQWAKSIDDWIWVQQFGIKLIVSLRGSQLNIEPVTEDKVKSLYYKYFPLIDGFHAVSKAIGIEAQKYGALPEKIKVVYSGLPESNFTSESKPKNSTFKILSVGRNHWVKGYHYALDCMKILSNHGIDFEYIIIGAKDVEELEFQKADLGLESSVIFKSKVGFQEVQQLMSDADLVLLPSVEEGIANVVLEAMQLGTMVLTTDCGGMDEVIENEKNGFMVPVRNPQKMAETIMKIISLSESEKQAIVKEAQLTIQQNHTEAKMVSDMLSLYETVLAR